MQLTRPTDTAVPLKSLDELTRVLDAEYDNPQFTVGLLAKFSRKLFEPNVYTKLKSMICLHKLMQELSSGAQNAVMQSVRSLRSETDEKVGHEFFSMESIELAADSASNVAELEAVELAREYTEYVLEMIDVRGERAPKSSSKKSRGGKGGKSKSKGGKGDSEEGEDREDSEPTGDDDRAEALLNLAELSEAIHKVCKGSKSGGGGGPGQVAQQCLVTVMEDRPWLIKQMQKLHEVRE
jgi:hypothetical protein